MNSRTKKRLTVVTGLIVIVMAIILAVVGGNSAARATTIAEAVSGDFNSQRIQVSGNVVKNSYHTVDNVLTFAIYDPEDTGHTLEVRYDGGVSATFGNDVTAICTGKMGDGGVLVCSELVTKCPSKYETSTEALSVSRMLEYGDAVLDKTVKVKGTVVAGSQNPAGQGDRMLIADVEDPSITVAVLFDDALSEDTTADGATVIATGNMVASGKFQATVIALEG